MAAAAFAGVPSSLMNWKRTTSGSRSPAVAGKSQRSSQTKLVRLVIAVTSPADGAPLVPWPLARVGSSASTDCNSAAAVWMFWSSAVSRRRG